MQPCVEPTGVLLALDGLASIGLAWASLRLTHEISLAFRGHRVRRRDVLTESEEVAARAWAAYFEATGHGTGESHRIATRNT